MSQTFLLQQIQQSWWNVPMLFTGHLLTDLWVLHLRRISDSALSQNCAHVSQMIKWAISRYWLTWWVGVLGPRMYGVFESGCLRRRWSQGCWHRLARWISSPPPLSTPHALCLLQYWFFYTLLNSSPYNIHFSKPRVTVSNCCWELSCAVVIRQEEDSGLQLLPLLPRATSLRTHSRGSHTLLLN